MSDSDDYDSSEGESALGLHSARTGQTDRSVDSDDDSDAHSIGTLTASLRDDASTIQELDPMAEIALLDRSAEECDASVSCMYCSIAMT